MNKYSNFVVAIVAILSSACTPLQQAPLVYSSKIAVGIDVSATSTESPGVSLTVGYKQVDAAYVPVAVAKECEEKTGTHCLNGIYKLTLVNGESNTNGTSIPTTTEQAANMALKDYEQAVQDATVVRLSRTAAYDSIKALSDRQAVLSLQEKTIQGKRTLLPALDIQRQTLDEKKATGTITTVETQELNDIESKIKDISALSMNATDSQELAGIGAKILSAQAIASKLTDELASKDARVKELTPNAKLAEQYKNNLVRKDAFSVYGRFESATKAEGTAASVGLGKVFSTGVASQNLAQGLGDYYKSLGMASCYDAVARIKTSTMSDIDLQKMIAACRAKVID